MSYRKPLTVVAAFGLLVSAAVSHAFPIAAPGTEGLPVLVGGSGPVIATYQGNSAAYSNDLYLMLDQFGNPGDDGNLSNDLFIFNNHASSVGDMVNLGSFAIGTELIFRLHVNNTGYDFYTGVASRNPDNHEHARVQQNWMPNETLVSFEDLYNGPFVYNDLSFSFTNTQTTPPQPPNGGAPAPGILLLMGAGIAGLGVARRRIKG